MQTVAFVFYKGILILKGTKAFEIWLSKDHYALDTHLNHIHTLAFKDKK